MIYYFFGFARYCIARRAKLKNWPTLEHSPGEAACSNVERYMDSHARRGILRANGGGGWSTIVRGEEGGGGNKRLPFPGLKAASDVELQLICFFSFFSIPKKLAGT